MTRSKLTPEGACAKCGSPDMKLAQDSTDYTNYWFVDGAWRRGKTHTEDMDSGDPLGNVRFFCNRCGEYHEVPEDLE